MTSASDEKKATFQLFFSRVGLRTYQHPCTLCGQRAEFWNLNVAVHMQIIALNLGNFMERMHSSEAVSSVAVEDGV